MNAPQIPENGRLDTHGMLICDACERIAPPGVLLTLCDARDRGNCELNLYAAHCEHEYNPDDPAPYAACLLCGESR